MHPPAEQTARVSAYFAAASHTWGRRYERPPQRMSDLDLLLRRRAALEALAPLLVRDRPPDLLDVGCGAGNLLADVPPGRARLYGVDLAPEMVAAAAARRPDAELHVADAGVLPFADRSMDIVTSLGVLEYLPDPAAALREIARVLRSDGHLVVSFPNRRSLLRRASRIEVALEQHLHRTLNALRGRTAPADAPPAYQHRAWSAREAEALLRAGGFAMCAARFHTYGLWGQLGRLAVARRLSCVLSDLLPGPSAVAAAFACTFVLLARLREDAR